MLRRVWTRFCALACAGLLAMAAASPAMSHSSTACDLAAEIVKTCKCHNNTLPYRTCPKPRPPAPKAPAPSPQAPAPAPAPEAPAPSPEAPAPAPSPKPKPQNKWINGTASWYTSRDAVPIGATGTELTPFCSVALKNSAFFLHENQRLEIKDWGIFRVADRCVGATCEDVEIFVGKNEGHARRLPNWEQGIIPITYRYLPAPAAPAPEPV